MTEPNWIDSTLQHEVRVDLLDPLTLTEVRGTLDGVNTGIKITYNYDGYTRVGATLSTSVLLGTSDGWDGTAAMRIWHIVGDWSEAVFTGYVAVSPPFDDESGVRTTSYTLKSSLYGLDAEISGYPYTVAKGAMGLTVLKNVFNKCKRPYKIMPLALDYRFGSLNVKKAGDTFRKIAFEVAAASGDRLDVDGMGLVTVDRYVLPSNKEPKYEFDTADNLATTVGAVSGSDNALEIPSRVYVHASEDDREIIGVAELGSTSPYNRNRRGYSLDSFHDVTDMTPFNKTQADNLAKSYLAQETVYQSERDFKTLYRPINGGDVVRLIHNGEYGKYMIEDAVIDTSDWVMSLSLKGV